MDGSEDGDQSVVLSKCSLMDVIKRAPIKFPIHLKVVKSRVVPVTNRGLFYRLWLFDGMYATSYGLMNNNDFWDSKIVSDLESDREKETIIRVDKLRCQTLEQVNRPVIYLDSVKVEAYKQPTNAHTSVDLDEYFEGDLDNVNLATLGCASQSSVQAEIRPLMSIATFNPNVAGSSALMVKDENKPGYREIDARDADLASQGQVRARLSFMSPLIWQPQGNYRKLTFSTRYLKISGTISEEEEENCTMPRVNEACILKNIPTEKVNVTFKRNHFGDVTSTELLPEIKCNFVPLSNVRALQTNAVCDVIGVLSSEPKMKGYGNERRSILINICDPTCTFELPVEMWPTATTGLDFKNNPIVAILGARRSSLKMSCVAVRTESMILVNPTWLKEYKQLEKWWTSKEDVVECDSFDEALEILENNMSQEFIIPKLTVAKTMESLNFQIFCTLCNEKAFELAQQTFVCQSCGPVEKVLIDNIKTSLYDGSKHEWVFVKDKQLRSMLGLASPLFGSIDNPELYMKVLALKDRKIRARLESTPAAKSKFLLLEATFVDEEEVGMLEQ